MIEAKPHILIVDDEQGIRLSLQGILEDEGYICSQAKDGNSALEFLTKEHVHLIILDIWLAETRNEEANHNTDGLLLLQHIKKIDDYKNIPVIMVSGHGTIETAVTALKYGAYDFIEKPLSLDSVINTVQRAVEVESLKTQNIALKKELDNQELNQNLVGKSQVMQTFKSALASVAPTPVWVLITGENGTGKEVTARALHKASQRADKAFIAINCAAIPEELIESELFGHEKGSFTGAEARIGKFELADKGTLFLDEIGDMSLKTQAKILRVLQEQCFERVGGNKTIKVDVRILAATNKDLEKAMSEGSFRSDLYYRLRGFPLNLPPLRERAEDIPLLTIALSQEMYANNMLPPVFSPQAMLIMQKASWKGNVRELKHVLEQLTILYPEQVIEPHMLMPLLSNEDASLFEAKLITALHSQASPAKSCLSSAESNIAASEASSSNEEKLAEEIEHFTQSFLSLDYKSAKNEFEQWYLEKKLEEAENNMTKLSDLVGLERSYLHRKLKPKK